MARRTIEGTLMADHAELLNAKISDLIDDYDSSDGPITKENCLEALVTSMVGILSSIEPRALRRSRIMLYQKALEVADSGEDDNAPGVLQ